MKNEIFHMQVCTYVQTCYAQKTAQKGEKMVSILEYDKEWEEKKLRKAEYEAGVEMGSFFAEKGIKTAAIYGAFIPNPMHVYRVAGVLSGLGLSYDGATEEGEVVGKIFTDQSVDSVSYTHLTLPTSGLV